MSASPSRSASRREDPLRRDGRRDSPRDFRSFLVSGNVFRDENGYRGSTRIHLSSDKKAPETHAGGNEAFRNSPRRVWPLPCEIREHVRPLGSAPDKSRNERFNKRRGRRKEPSRPKNYGNRGVQRESGASAPGGSSSVSVSLPFCPS